jgi:Ca-activated chloride channel family protein
VTRATGLLAAVLAVAWVEAQQPVFRARTEMVRVDVLVTDDGVPVGGLLAADFEVRDNGVPQRVAAASAIEDLQLGVVFDASGSMTGERLAIARAATGELLAQLRPSDRFALVAFGDQVGRVAPAGATASFAIEALARVRAGGATAMVDGIFAGILEAAAEPGPTLLLVMTDGRNNASWLRATDVIDVARRLETTIYPVAIGVETRPAPLPGPGPGAGFGLPHPSDVDREWRGIVKPTLRTADSLALLRLMAEGTGGRHLTAKWDTSLGDVFTGILAEYRQRYILSFTPEGVGTADGWHTLDVKVKRRGLVVRSRTRYWAD